MIVVQVISKESQIKDILLFRNFEEAFMNEHNFKMNYAKSKYSGNWELLDRRERLLYYDLITHKYTNNLFKFEYKSFCSWQL